MNSKWVQFDPTDDQRELTRNLVNGSTAILGLLAKVLMKDLQELETTSPKDYSIENWPYWRADRDGQVRAIKQLLKLMGDQP